MPVEQMGIFEVHDVLGHTAVAGDKASVRLGLCDADANVLGLQLSNAGLQKLLAQCAAAFAVFPLAEKSAVDTALGVESADCGYTPSTAKIFMRLNLPEGGRIAFNLDRKVAAGLVELLRDALDDARQEPQPGMALN